MFIMGALLLYHRNLNNHRGRRAAEASYGDHAGAYSGAPPGGQEDGPSLNFSLELPASQNADLSVIEGIELWR